jgi:hypothetical protein
VSFLEALGCPYCGGALFKESYYFRCSLDHRFRTRLGIAAGEDDEVDAGQGGSCGPRLLLEVVWHPDRGEVGRLHSFPLGEDRV